MVAGCDMGIKINEDKIGAVTCTCDPYTEKVEDGGSKI